MNVVNDTRYLWNKTNNYYLADTFFSDNFDGREMEYIRKTDIDMEAFALILMIFGSILWMCIIVTIVTLYLHEHNEG